ncbi:MAG: universal stress protein [Chitinophagaceae bacterium]
MIETILLPTDFSETAKNAGLYAVELAFQIGAKKVVVYHTYEVATSLSSVDNTNENVASELSRQESASKVDMSLPKCFRKKC